MVGQVGKCLKLSKGNVRIANRQYNTCKHRYELVFDKMAQALKSKWVPSFQAGGSGGR